MKIGILAVFFAPAFIVAQFSTESDVKDFIASSKYKIWIYDDFELVMQGSDDCEEGKTYTFFRDNKVIISDCVKKKWVRKSNKYSLRKESDFDWWITINEQEYYLVMTTRPYEHELKLRITKSGKSDPNEDIILINKLDD